MSENSPKTASDIMTRLFAIRQQKADLESEVKTLGEEWAGLEAELLRQMEEQGSSRVGIDGLGLAIRTATIVPVVEDWDAFYAFIKDNDMLYLLQKRVGAPAYRELLEAGTPPAGTRPFEKVTLNLRGST